MFKKITIRIVDLTVSLVSVSFSELHLSTCSHPEWSYEILLGPAGCRPVKVKPVKWLDDSNFLSCLC